MGTQKFREDRRQKNRHYYDNNDDNDLQNFPRTTLNTTTSIDTIEEERDDTTTTTGKSLSTMTTIPYSRPAKKERKFISSAVENVINDLTQLIRDKDLARLF